MRAYNVIVAKDNDTIERKTVFCNCRKEVSVEGELIKCSEVTESFNVDLQNLEDALSTIVLTDFQKAFILKLVEEQLTNKGRMRKAKEKENA